MNRITPNIIYKTSNEIDQIALKRIQEAINQDDKEIDRIVPKIIKSVIEEFHKTLFRILGQFGRKKYAQIKQKF